MSVYLGIAVPHLVDRKDPTNCKETGAAIKNEVERGSRGHFATWNMPAGNFRVGTLDSLVGLSDEMQKYDSTLRNVCTQVKKIFEDYEGKPNSLVINEKKPEDYLQKFRWNAKYQETKSLGELVEQMMTESRSDITKVVKVRAVCQEKQRKLGALEKRTQGSLIVRDFSSKLQKSDVVDTESLCTIFVVVSKGRLEDFLTNYSNPEKSREAARLKQFASDTMKKDAARDAAHAEHMEKQAEQAGGDEKEDANAPPAEQKPQQQAASNPAVKKKAGQSLRMKAAATLDEITACPLVVPTSAKLIMEDQDTHLYRVVCLRKAVDAITVIYKDQRYVVRPLPEDWDKPIEDNFQQQVKVLKAELKKNKSRLLQACKVFYANCFQAWAHFKCIRLFVEAVLRYGLPVKYTFSLIKLQNKGVEPQIHERLSQRFRNLMNDAMVDNKNAKKGKKEVDYTGMGESYRPYVFTKMVLP